MYMVYIHLHNTYTPRTSLYLADTKKDLYIARLVSMTTTIMTIISTSPPNTPPITTPTGVSSSLLYYYSDLKPIYVTIQLLTQLEQ